MKALIVIFIFLVAGCGDIGIGSSHKSITTTDDHGVDDHSVRGDTTCHFECEPVDAEDCNIEGDNSALCFKVINICEGPGSQILNGPEFTQVAPQECVIVNPNQGLPEEPPAV